MLNDSDLVFRCLSRAGYRILRTRLDLTASPKPLKHLPPTSPFPEQGFQERNLFSPRHQVLNGGGLCGNVIGLLLISFIMTKFRFLLTFLLLGLLCAAEEKPNLVFIIADDLGWADVAFHGGNAPTPHLDRLAREGLHFGNAFCTTPLSLA